MHWCFWSIILFVFMQEIKWKTKVKKRKSLTNSCLLTVWVIEDSQLCISLIRARLGPWKDWKTGVRSFFLSVLSSHLRSPLLLPDSYHTRRIFTQCVHTRTMTCSATPTGWNNTSTNAYNWPRGWGTGARAEEEIRFCFRNEAWAAKVYLVGSANCVLRGWGVPEEDTMALQADSAIKHKYLTLQSMQMLVWTHSFGATDMVSIKFHPHLLKCLCVTTRNEVNSSVKGAPEHLKSTLPLSKKQMWLLHSWKFSLGRYFVVSYMLWNNTNKAEIICFLPVVVKYSLFMTTFFPTISLQEHSRRNHVTVTQEHGSTSPDPVLGQTGLKIMHKFGLEEIQLEQLYPFDCGYFVKFIPKWHRLSLHFDICKKQTNK